MSVARKAVRARRMLRFGWRITKVTSKVSLALLACHVCAKAFLEWERLAARYAVSTANAMVDTAAVRLGYEKPAPEPTPLDAMALAEREALRHGINPSLVRALMRVESGNKENALSPKGAIGLLQIMPANAPWCGLRNAKDLWEPEHNIRCGVKILAESLKARRGDVTEALMVYNGGTYAVKNRYPESVKHARLVLAEMAKDIR